MKNDGTWKPKPSGLKKGNLSAWRDMMFAARAVPEIDDIVVDRTEDGEIIGYLCIVPDGYNSYWKRVAKLQIDVGAAYQRSGSGYQNQGASGYQQDGEHNQSSSIFYTERAAHALFDDDNPGMTSRPDPIPDDDIPF